MNRGAGKKYLPFEQEDAKEDIAKTQSEMIKEFAKLSFFTFQAAPAAKSTTIDKEEEKGVKTQKSSVRRVI